MLLFSLPNYALSVGLTAKQGSIIGALLNLGQGIGRPIVGFFSDSAGRINIAGFLTILCGLFCLIIWTFAKNYGVLIFFSILVGTVSGTFWTTIAPVGAEIVGLKELPSALSIVWLVLVIPTTCQSAPYPNEASSNILTTVSEPIGLELRQTSGNIYIHAQIYTGIMYIAAALCMWFLRAWKIGELEELAAEQGQSLQGIDAIQSHALVKPPSRASRLAKSSILKRLFMWKRV